MTGCIFDIKRFAIHDGPGIRTTVFFKGCPLRCVWCHNPEGLSYDKGIWVKEERCVRCGSCVSACGGKAISMGERAAEIDRGKCVYCNQCLEVCPTCAVKRIDRVVEAGALAKELAGDKLFMDVSRGGVTLSGGEPLSQPEFAMALLKNLKALEVATCMETSMAAPQDVVRTMVPYLDHLIADLKLIDSGEHCRFTGMPNEQILDNFRYLASNCRDVTVRIPLIPWITATDENLMGIARFVANCDPHIPIELINYNPLAPNKYRFLGQEYYAHDVGPVSEEELARFKQLIEGGKK